MILSFKDLIHKIFFYFKSQKDGSLPISQFFRRLFESSFVKPTLGLYLVIIIILIGYFTYPTYASTAQEAILAAPTTESFRTETNFNIPILGVVSQKFHWYHPAIDILGNLNQPIYPIAAGRVIEVEYYKWGYGHKIVLEHDNGFKSLYAHLGDIKVKIGDEVDKNTIIAGLGLTGWTTGAHLHLEIWQNDNPIDPLTVLPDFSVNH